MLVRFRPVCPDTINKITAQLNDRVEDESNHIRLAAIDDLDDLEASIAASLDRCRGLIRRAQLRIS